MAHNTPINDRLNRNADIANKESAEFQTTALNALIAAYPNQDVRSLPVYALIGAMVRLINAGSLDIDSALAEFNRHISR